MVALFPVEKARPWSLAQRWFGVSGLPPFVEVSGCAKAQSWKQKWKTFFSSFPQAQIFSHTLVLPGMVRCQATKTDLRNQRAENQYFKILCLKILLPARQNEAEADLKPILMLCYEYS